MNEGSIDCEVRTGLLPGNRYAARMGIYLSHRSALTLWRMWSCAHPLPLRDFHDSGKQQVPSLPFQMLPASTALKGCSSSLEAVAQALGELPGAALDVLGLGAEELKAELRPLEILVGKRAGMRSLESIRRHRCALKFPRNAFLRMTPQVWVSAPELVFVQMAGRLSFGELVALGYELCGSYPLMMADRGALLVRRPLTTPDRLVSFANQMKDAKAVKLARSAAVQVRRKSASVMETETAILTLTSRRRGGLGLPDARLNAVVALGERGRRIAHQERIVCDMYWPDHKVAVEYDGQESHKSPSAQARDSRRRDGLSAEGIDFATVTAAQLSNVFEFFGLMKEVSRKVGKPLRPLTPDQLSHHMELRRQVRKFHREHFSR